MDCVFCKIVADRIPAVKVRQDEHTVAFMDINPLTEGHLLVVPRVHVPTLFDAEEATLEATLRAVRALARAMRAALGLDSLNVLQANGPWAAQSVPHLHFHLIPRRQGDGAPLDWPLRPGQPEAIRAAGERIAAAL
jgi:histidine triad (HIT) family protein